MAKKRAATKSAQPTKKKAKEEEIVLDPIQDKALRLADKSAKFRAELEQAVTLAATKAVRKVLKDHGLSLTASQACLLTSIWFGE